MEQGLAELLFGIPYLTDEQLVELYQSVGSFDRGAWKAKAAILWEAKQRSTYGDKAWEAMGKTFGIGWRQAYNLARVWQTFFIGEDGQFCNQLQNCALDEVSWYITTAETDDPKFWLAYAEDRKAEHPFYTVAGPEGRDPPRRRQARGRRQLRHRHAQLPLGARLLRPAGPGGEPGALRRLRAAAHPREGSGDRMTTFTYEEKLVSFADGKRLRRFRGYLRAPSNTTCDACGSTLPSYLHALRDIGAGKDYFVGGNCYVRLHQLGVLERPYVRASIATAYLQRPRRAGRAPPLLQAGERPAGSAGVVSVPARRIVLADKVQRYWELTRLVAEARRVMAPLHDELVAAIVEHGEPHRRRGPADAAAGGAAERPAVGREGAGGAGAAGVPAAARAGLPDRARQAGGGAGARRQPLGYPPHLQLGDARERAGVRSLKAARIARR